MTPFLAFAHLGDLHLTEADAPNARDLGAIVAQLNAVEGLHFAYLPGDNADQGRPDQYALVRAALDALRLPTHVITGDHDMEGGNLGAFYAGLGVPRLPYAATVGGVRCLFLDMCGPGAGGPDFRLGPDQVAWLEVELDAARAGGTDCALFMHSYPADLQGPGEATRVAQLIHHGPVRLVEMGHTHYNELANDGRTIYAAARSTGQTEEGPVGYAVAALDAGVASWRFKELDRPWPFVLVTAPADRRLAHDAAHVVAGAVTVRALVLGDAPVARCEVRAADGPWYPMTALAEPDRYEAMLRVEAGTGTLTVRATDARGRQDAETIALLHDAADLPTSRGPGSDADRIEAWAEKGLLGTQLGPNRNGRHW